LHFNLLKHLINTNADISTPSDTDSESEETQPSEIEFRILQKELQSCTQQKDLLQSKNMVCLHNG